MPQTSSLVRLRSAGFSRMEMLVVIAIVVVIGAIGHPIYKVFKVRAGRQVALDSMRQLANAVTTYVGQHDGALPDEDGPGKETWTNISKPESKNAWYNALPPLIGRKAAGDFAVEPKSYYSKANIIYLSGANYPGKKKFIEPLFAIAFNTKLQRRNEAGEKEPTKVADVKEPSRTVVLMEQGLPNEHKTLEVQSNNDYDGAPKGSAKSFVGRYNGQGMIAFLDGHADLVNAAELLTETGTLPFPPTTVVWGRSAEENPNKAVHMKKK